MATFVETGRKIVAVGKNYRKHIAEMAQIGTAKDEKFVAEGPKVPVLFFEANLILSSNGCWAYLVATGDWTSAS